MTLDHFNRIVRIPLLTLGALLSLSIAACGNHDTGGQKDGSDGGSDGGDGGTARYEKPEGYASVTFFVDDTTNKTYQSGNLEWKGSFVYDDKTNVINYDGSWGGEIGPYPTLYDDGPISQGGHEMPGAKANDHIFSAEVYVLAKTDFDQEFQYGVINEFDNWIWEGPNGKYTLPKGSTGRIDADGYYLHGFGTYDLMVALDSSQLNSGFLPFDPGVDKIFLKGSMNSWDKRQLLDNGQKGDAAAGDGIYTYVHSLNLGPHDGLLYAGQHVQFVFMINELEYKRVDALQDGVSAKSNCDGATTWGVIPIYLEEESRGKVKNTTVTVCQGAGGVEVTSVVPNVGPPEGGSAVAIYGSGFMEGATITFDGVLATEVQFVSAGQMNGKAPAHAAGPVAVRVTNPKGEFGELNNAYTYGGEQPEILFVEPSIGPLSGGTPVTITGQRFANGATVEFGENAASGVVVTNAQEIRCTTPAATATGSVTVKVTNPDSQSASFPNGFEYVLSTGPHIQQVTPSKGSTKGGDEIQIVGSGFDSGAAVDFGGVPASNILVESDGSIRCTTPAHEEGAVDLRVVNPDTRQDSLPSGFFFEHPHVDWALLKWPLSLTVNTDTPSDLVFGQAYKSGLTEPVGPAPGLTAQLGFGPAGSNPENDPTAWQWQDAEYNTGCTTCGNNDEYQDRLTIADPGQYDYAYRFTLDGGETWTYADSNGTQDGYQPANAGQVTVRGGVNLEIWEVQPSAGTVLGGTAITVSGNAFAEGAKVSLGGQELVTTFVDSHTLQATTLAHGLGAIDVLVTNSDNSTATKTSGFSFVLRGTPLIDGVIDTSAGTDWNSAFLMSENQTPSNWGDNRIEKLYVAFDDQNLYLGIVGYVEANNAIVAYLDTDFGPATGIRDMNTLTDSSDGLDNVISSKVLVTANGFGVENAAGTKGMANSDNAQMQDAGLRHLVSPDSVDNFGWSVSTVKCGADAVEFALPYAALFAGGVIPDGGAQVAVFFRLLNYDGQYMSNATLPPDNPVTPEQVTQVFAFTVR